MVRHGTEAARSPLSAGRRVITVPVEDVMLGTQQVAERHLAGCHLVLVSPDLSGSVKMVHRLLYWAEWWLQPETLVVVMGNNIEGNSLLYNFALRNTQLAFYIAPYASSQGKRGTVQIYRRCLYCHSGNAGVQQLYRWVLDGGLPQDLRLFMNNEYKEDLNGHRFRVVTMTYFPYINYVRESDAPGTAVRLTDSLNTRMMEALARHLNFR
ncbi:hypothetical protein E2C01_047425 [Portunus trituberculatus]|uniref:Uncharacterized protein n=1 Tax=Portunus trituberculatus TaxID=210409 RepID=A0A5B7G129_PORTR|nr:hypothetical protein [Portunus trituberculatus]